MSREPASKYAGRHMIMRISNALFGMTRRASTAYRTTVCARSLPLARASDSSRELAFWLGPEPGVAGRVLVKLPHLADLAVPDVEDVRGVLVYFVAAALGELVMQRHSVLVPADHVVQSDLDCPTRACKQLTEERQDGIAPALSTGQAAAARYMPDRVVGKQPAERRGEFRLPEPLIEPLGLPSRVSLAHDHRLGDHEQDRWTVAGLGS